MSEEEINPGLNAEGAEDAAAPAKAGPVKFPPCAYGPRNLSALQVSRKLGFEKRIVLYWCNRDEPPCPHDMTTKRGQPSPLLNLTEVIQWREAQGKAAAKTGGDTTGLLIGGAAIVRPGPEGVLGGGEHKKDDLWKTREARVAEAGSDVDYANLIARLKVQMEDLLTQKPPEGAQPDWATKWAERVSAVSKELRQLADAKREDEEKRGVWIRKSAADEMLSAAATRFTSAQRTLRGKLPAALAAALADLIPADRLELARRAISVCTAAECDRVAKEAADGIEAQVENAAPGRAAA